MTHTGMVRVQQVLDKLGYLWRLLKIELGTYKNLGLLKLLKLLTHTPPPTPYLTSMVLLLFF